LSANWRALRQIAPTPASERLATATFRPPLIGAALSRARKTLRRSTLTIENEHSDFRWKISSCLKNKGLLWKKTMKGSAMESAEPVTTIEPSKADLRRAQVLEAAAKCFNTEGFHSASMSSIATEAGLSVGQIYRYFENKEAVIAAIVEQKLAEWAQSMAEARARSGDMLEELMDTARFHIEKVVAPGQAALSLEFLAEAARNPRIGEIVRVVDSVMRRHLKDILLRNGASEDEKIEGRVDMIAMLIDGWIIRGVKNPNLKKEDFLEALRPLFEILLHCPQRNCP
jgi:AcrR family transcriptional regulator